MIKLFIFILKIAIYILIISLVEYCKNFKIIILFFYLIYNIFYINAISRNK